MSNWITQKNLILASGSQARKKLLASLGLEFKIIPSLCDEDEVKKRNGAQVDFLVLAQLLATTKALEVSNRHPEDYILAADQLCICDQSIFDKPGCHKVALEQLLRLSGKTHQQISAFCIVKNKQVLFEGSDTAALTMKKLNVKTIDRYLQQDKPYQSCGAYHYEGYAKWLFAKVEGSESTIQGLPLLLVAQALEELKIVSI